MSLQMETASASFNEQIVLITQRGHHQVDRHDEADLESTSSFSDASCSLESTTSESNSLEEVTSSPSELPASTAARPQHTASPLQDMSSLLQQLPIKRGLSKHYQGKSQSFSSLSVVRSLEDLAKAENPCNKKLRSCGSYGGLLGTRIKPSSRLISKKASRPGAHHASSSPSLNAKRNNNGSHFIGSRPPPIPLPRCSTATTRVSSQTSFLFA